MNFDWTSIESEMKTKVAALFDEAAARELENLEDADLPGLKNTTLCFAGKLGALGYLALAQGPGQVQECLTLAAAQEGPAKASGSLFLALETSARLFGGLLAGFGASAEQKEILEQIRQGRILGAVALSEPGGDQPQAAPLCTARPTDAGFLVSGRKGFVTNGPLADWLAVGAKVDGQDAFFLVQPGQEGLAIGPRIKTLGYNGLAVSTVELADVKVPTELVLGPFGDDRAIKYLQATQDLVLAAAALGVLARSLAEANAYARRHHRGTKPIFSHQEVRFKVADMFTLFQSCQLLIYRAAWHSAVGDREADVLIRCAKVFVAEASETTANLAMQIMAGQGYVSGNAVERGYREAKYAALAGTTSELSRMAIASEILARHPA
ncbi:MAG: acyl-CoA dehydrogenase [Pseudomonadota bacterium]